MSIKSWWGETNPIRVRWGAGYLIVGVCLLVLRCLSLGVFDWIRFHWVDLSWVVGWANIGIGVGLLNSRVNGADKDTGVEKEHWHYIIYFCFALVVSSLASFALSRNEGILDYPLSALIALTSGFAAERINDLTLIKKQGSC
ncbi:MAG: hypothetical protein ABIC18_03850 [Candidatus Omnitrophota bacterium]